MSDPWRDERPQPIEMNDAWLRNFRAALAEFIQEELPVDDVYTDEMNDEAWRIADVLVPSLLRAFVEVQSKVRQP